MQTLYPKIQPYNSQQLTVDERHTLYLEQCGNPDGLPVLFLHGGPGSGCDPTHRRFFDPERYRIILFDQRGSGRSTPHADLTDNTTWHLVADIEHIRQTLAIDRWVLFGGSWGTTLALAYAQTHPDAVCGMILRGIFLGRQCDLDWLYQTGAKRLFPDAWEAFIAPIPAAERADLLQAYHQRLTSQNELDRLRAAKAWANWEGALLTLHPDPQAQADFANPHRALSLARIECHYFMHHCFLAHNQLIQQAHRLAGIPGYIVHGRYDLITPLDNAWELAKAWPDAELRIVTEAGHAATEPGTTDALITATRNLWRELAT